METMTKEQEIDFIAGRIINEYRKHGLNLKEDWHVIAASKIHSQWKEYWIADRDKRILELEKEKWISVKSEMPKGRVKECLGFNGDAPEYNQHVFPFTWFDQNNTIKTDSKYMGTITHWQPLPDKPKDA